MNYRSVILAQEVWNGQVAVRNQHFYRSHAEPTRKLCPKPAETQQEEGGKPELFKTSKIIQNGSLLKKL